MQMGERGINPCSPNFLQSDPPFQKIYLKLLRMWHPVPMIATIWKNLLIHSLAGLALSLSTLAAEDVREIGWSDLLPSEPIEFNDPFAELSQEQLRELSLIARFRTLRARDAVPADGESAQNEKRLVAKFNEQGIDVDRLLSQRDSITQQRRKRAEQVDANVVGQTIRIPGFVLPLETGGNGIREFLLVPWVGACIHTPPPPANQMIHVTVPEGFADNGRFAPIWIEGQLTLKPAQYDIFLVDGSGTVSVAYAVASATISDYSPADSDILAQIQAPEFSNEHSWFDTIQTRVSLMFTKAMTSIRDRESSAPLWTGLLVAFVYGLIHTLGPGHGKAVVISYFIGEGGTFGRGIAMGTKIAVFHVLSAIIVVWVMDFAVRQATGSAPSDYRAVKLISYATIAVIGGWMLWKALRQPKHTHDHDHHSDCHACDAAKEEIKGMGGWLALAVGSVPCTGALLVLLFGMANNLLGPAILLVIAISTGMAVAMSAIGVLAIAGRNSVEKRFSASGRHRFTGIARIAASALVMTIGCGLFMITYGLV